MASKRNQQNRMRGVLVGQSTLGPGDSGVHMLLSTCAPYGSPEERTVIETGKARFERRYGPDWRKTYRLNL